MTFDSDSIQLVQSCLMHQVNNEDDHNMNFILLLHSSRQVLTGMCMHYEFLQPLLFHLVDRVTDRRLMECTYLSLLFRLELSLGNITGKELLLSL